MGTIHDVRYYDSDMVGAPSNAGMAAAGRLIAILDACAVNGFNLNAVSAIVVSNGIATATTPADQGFRDYTVIRVEGATPAELNGDWKVSVPNGTTFTWETPVPDGSATGTITAKTAPLGWTKEFVATNVGVYRPKTGLRHFFRVSDLLTAANNYAQVRGYELMTGSADAGTHPFPTATQIAYGITVQKATSSAYVQKWCLIGDDRCLFMIINPGESNGVQQTVADWAIYGFGEAISYTPNDLGASFVVGAGRNDTGGAGNPRYNATNYPGNLSFPERYDGCYFARPWSQELGAPPRFRIAGSGIADGWGSASNLSGRVPTPNPADLSLLFHHPVLMQEETARAVRGELPGAYQPLNTNMSHRIGDVVEVGGRKILLTHAYDSTTAATNMGSAGVMGWDITGPWR